MVDSPVGNTQPVGDRQSFGGAPYGRRHERHGEPAAPVPCAATPADGADVRRGRAVALELLRERVLARTRALLDLDASVQVRTFASATAPEDAETFAGRLLSEQNQLLALRAAERGHEACRETAFAALREAAFEVQDLLAGPSIGTPGSPEAWPRARDAIAEVLAAIARRNAAR